MRTTPIALLALAVTGAGEVCAHDTWLLARPALPDNSGAVVLDLTSGMVFPELDHAVAVNRISRTSIRIRGRATDIRAIS